MKHTLWLPLGVGLLVVAAGLGGCVRPRSNPTPVGPQVTYAPSSTPAATATATSVAAPEVTVTPEATAAPTTTSTPVEVEVVEPTATVAATAAPVTSEASGTEGTYVVTWGDTLSGIARTFGTTVEAIMGSNSQIADRNRINAGWMLTIPGGTTPDVANETGEYVIQPGDTLWGISQRFGVSTDALLNANPSITNPNYVYAGRTMIIPAGGDYTAPTVHVVVAGETLSGIAVRYNTTIWDIVMRNNLADANYIYAGQKLVIP